MLECFDPELATILIAKLGPEAIMLGDDVHARIAGSWGPPRPIATDLLVRPATTAEVSLVMSICHHRKQKVVVHGGLTGVVDGAWAEAGDLVLSMERLTAVEDVDPVERCLTVQAGASLQKVQDAAAAQDLLFPLDLGARGSATIGGNAATNAGGNRVIRFGMARQLILGLEVVLADGTVLSSMNTMLKNNAGFDLKQLFIGSEGSLGIITRLVLRLVPAPLSQCTALVSSQSFSPGIIEFLGHADGQLGGQLSAFEVMWGDFYDFVTERAGLRPALETGQPFYALIESLGVDQNSDTDRIQTMLKTAIEHGLITDAVIAKSEAERLALWAVRDEVSSLMQLKPMFVFDISLPLRDMQNYVDRLRAKLTDRWPNGRLFVFGHLGDGNLHLGIQAGAPAGDDREQVEEMVYRPLAKLGGSVSAEHGIGLEKKAYLGFCRSAPEIALMKQLKASLDPLGILNPGKIFDPD